jgi:hypothetical protein
MPARSRLHGIAFGIVIEMLQVMAFPAPAAVLKGPPVTVEVSSLDELKRALGTATPGSVIRLAAGIYQIYADDPYFLVEGVQGLPDQPIVIQGAPVREDGKRGTIIDGGRSLDSMLELQEHYRRPGSRPIELHDLLIQKQFRTERAINCFVFEDVAWLVIENLTVRNCLPASFVIYGNSRYVTIRSSTLVGAMAPVFCRPILGPSAYRGQCLDPGSLGLYPRPIGLFGPGRLDAEAWPHVGYDPLGGRASRFPSLSQWRARQ